MVKNAAIEIKEYYKRNLNKAKLLKKLQEQLKIAEKNCFEKNYKNNNKAKQNKILTRRYAIR